MTSASAARTRRFDFSLIGNALVLLALFALAVALARTQADAWNWIAPGRGQWWMAAALVAAYVGFVAAVAVSRKRSAQREALPEIRADRRGEWLVAFASQTGFAEQLARRSWQALRDAGLDADLAVLGTLDAEQLGQYRRALFVVSTTGEGDAPDSAAAFVRKVMSAAAPLPQLGYGVLALGDREYAEYCAFGHRLDHWLHRAGAQPLFDLVDVDNGEAGALRHWQHHLGLLAGRTDLPDWSAPAYAPWRLRERQVSNPGSAGASAFHLVLVPADGSALQWRAGDIAEIGPRNAADEVVRWLAEAELDGAARVRRDDTEIALADLLARSRLPSAADVRGHSAQAVADALAPLPHREYSIASIPADGALRLLVRQMRRDDGRLGLGSGWLTEYAGDGDAVDLRIRSNPSFHAPGDARPLILIGNGTGLAGLRALLRERIEAGHRRNWLLFGERNAACDLHYRDELEAWIADGRIERADYAFSRDGAQRVYVQDRVRERLAQVREWVAAGAAIYVCGSLEGMAPAVDAVLREALGDDALESMAAEGRYRRDVY
ncbi:sulfite reductase flavoprotein subunit alpha [Lysobacter sp. K5869]|uniref:sulfite reductase subunit alpha n=1 Tax=Lysobacter sp. K5869 TaxID=2820808 RepID=UPI001C062BB5|nr:sulfite reductase flavoprotein subunit alpha [Lysobacter sp. K5869]QWP76473.1 sulfite reductase flavoprotein subunit alpha [Lysobacter sp. K5869]